MGGGARGVKPLGLPFRMAAPVCPVCGSARVEPYATPFPDPVVRCRDCGTRFAHPVPSADALRSRYDEEHRRGKWDSLFEVSDPLDPPRRARLLTKLLRNRTRSAGPRRLLDVGCGDGRFLDAATASGWTPFGIELSWDAVRRLGRRHRVLTGPLQALRPEPRFAAVTFWDVLEHIPDPLATLREATLRLEPGGLVAVSLPSAAGTEARVEGRAWRYHDLVAYGHLLHVGPAQLARLLGRVGLEPIYSETRGSADLRNLLGPDPDRGLKRPATWVLDRLSGVLARVAEPMRRGNTLLMVARSPGAREAREGPIVR